MPLVTCQQHNKRACSSHKMRGSVEKQPWVIWMQKREFSTCGNEQSQALLSAWTGATSRDNLLFPVCHFSWSCLDLTWEYNDGIIITAGLGNSVLFLKFTVVFAIKLIWLYPLQFPFCSPAWEGHTGYNKILFPGISCANDHCPTSTSQGELASLVPR